MKIYVRGARWRVPTLRFARRAFLDTMFGPECFGPCFDPSLAPPALIEHNVRTAPLETRRPIRSTNAIRKPLGLYWAHDPRTTHRRAQSSCRAPSSEECVYLQRRAVNYFMSGVACWVLLVCCFGQIVGCWHCPVDRQSSSPNY